MAKIRIHELAKELDKQSKEIQSFLQGQGIEASRRRRKGPEGKRSLRERKILHGRKSPQERRHRRRLKRRKQLFL